MTIFCKGWLIVERYCGWGDTFISMSLGCYSGVLRVAFPPDQIYVLLLYIEHFYQSAHPNIGFSVSIFISCLVRFFKKSLGCSMVDSEINSKQQRPDVSSHHKAITDNMSPTNVLLHRSETERHGPATFFSSTRCMYVQNCSLFLVSSVNPWVLLSC